MAVDIDNPGRRLERLRLTEPVLSCADAADAKGVDLERELKSLLLRTDHGQVLVSIRGDRMLSLRAIKLALDVDQARLASSRELEALSLAPGTVHPFAPAVWGMRQLVTRGVLQLDWVTTNAGESDRYVVFPPTLLLSAPAVSVGDFER